MEDKEKLVMKLHEIGAIKFGEFTLTSGKVCPYYIDLRFLASYPDILKLVTKEYGKILKKIDYEILVGVPYAAIPLATAIALELNKPMIFTRKEAKEHGTKKLIEGIYKKGQKAAIIDDVISDGDSKFKVIDPLEKEGLIIKDIIVLVDRGHRGPDTLREKGYNCHSILHINDILSISKKHGKIDDDTMKKAEAFINSL
jgi:uridine monophosphate synthetase